MSQRRYKDTENSWKIKAIKRGKENNILRKRNKELEASREMWKSRSKELSKRGSGIELRESPKAMRHKYSLLLVSLIIAFHGYGSMSLRGCRHCAHCLLLSLGLSGGIPSHSSIRNWLCKCGYNRIMEGKKSSGDYVLYLDESIVFGSEKMLLILGVSQNKIPTDRGLRHSDVEVLYVGASQEWKGEDIAQELTKIEQQKRIKYVISDEGHNLRKAYKSMNYTHIEDCTHVLANHLKRIYGSDEDFEAFRKLIGQLRKDWNLSKENSRYMPPTMRGKMRFANIFPCVDWANKMLDNWQNLPPKVQDSLVFLQQNQILIQSLTETGTLFKTICETLKTQGFAKQVNASLVAYLDNSTLLEKPAVFAQNCKEYLHNLSDKSTLLAIPHLLCSSDIIESFFGKFKTKINPNNHSGLTQFIFTIANFSNPFSIKETLSALENIRLKDIPKKRLNSA